jgi:hypothetical protein
MPITKRDALVSRVERIAQARRMANESNNNYVDAHEKLLADEARKSLEVWSRYVHAQL